MNENKFVFCPVESPQFVEAGDSAEIVFAPKMPFVCSAYDKCKPLGRMAAMDSNSLIVRYSKSYIGDPAWFE